MQNARRFFATYVSGMRNVAILDIGIDAGGTSLKRAIPKDAKYVGVDLAPGPGVDVVLEDPYKFPFADDSFGVVVSSSCFEHSELFWLLYLEIMRVLTPSGLFYLNAPANGIYHRYPVDCWRFYPDCGAALVRWGRMQGLNNAVLESYTSNQHLRESWNDFVCVFIKDGKFADRYPRRIMDSFSEFANGFVGPQPESVVATPRNPQIKPQDHRYYGWKLQKRLQKLRWYLSTGFGRWEG